MDDDQPPPPPFEEDEKNALEGLVEASGTPRKTHSYSQQLRTNTGTNINKRRNQLRNHSLDDSSNKNIIFTVSSSSSSNSYGYYVENSDDDDDGFFPYSTSVTPGASSAEFIQPFRMIRSYDTDGGGSEFHHYHHQQQQQHQQQHQQPMPEFAGTGGGVGIFKVPSRAAVHPSRPPSLELRPHPLRETQVGKFLRTIACTETELWGGQECGVRVWNLSDAFKLGNGTGGRARRGDGDAAPFYESVSTSPVLSLMVDPGSKLVWSGHKDGKIRSWKTDQPHSQDSPFRESLSWQAHRGPVLSMVISSYGDIWSGSEGGFIKIWSWEAVEKSLSLSQEERRMAALLVERSAIDLRSQVTVNGVCNISSSDVRYLLSDTARARVWAVSSVSFSLWDARNRELIKVFNIEGQSENRVDMSSVQDQAIEDEMNVKFVTKSKKEKPQGFLQRSRITFGGAADTVRRVATRGAGAFGEDNKKTETIVLAADGLIWTGCSNGLIVQWDGNGNRVQDFLHHPCAVLSFCSYASRIWVGYISGMVQVFDLEGKLLAGWIAHNSPIIKLVVGKETIFSLANHGGIRGWSIASPAPTDGIVRQILAEKELIYTRRENVKILIGTWNVGQGRVSQESLITWLRSAASDVGIVVVGLQEVEMSASFLAMSAAKETVGLEGSSTGLWWQESIGRVLDETSTFERVGSRQLAGLLIAIWVRKTLRGHIGDLDVGAVACGLGRAIGNKGGVGLRLRVYDRIMCFANCHFAAHLEAVNRRNADFDHIFRTMTFARPSNLLNNAAGQTLRSQNSGNNPDDGKPDFADADMVVFTGDFNYRLFGISYDEARDFVSQRTFDWLREKDQLRAEMQAGKVFQGMREAVIRFPPTYKFERGKPGLGGYDSGDKKRIPAWCDRVLYRDNRGAPTEECSLECPVVASILQYDACMDVTESDHKPVRCKFNVEIAHVDRSVRREELGKILESNKEIRAYQKELQNVPEILLSHNKIVLQHQETFNLRISNRSKTEKAFYQIVCQGQSTIREDEHPEHRPRGSYGFPHWLEVMPAAGVIKPDQVAEISIHHQDFHTLEEYVEGIPQSWWSEDTRDKEIILLVNIRGSISLATRSHQIHVHQRFSTTSVHLNSKCIRRKHQEGSQHRTSNQRSTNRNQGSSQHGTSHQRSTNRKGAANSEITDKH